MFSGYKNLTKIILPTDEKSTSIQYCYEMFSGCYTLTSIDLSKFSFVNIDDLSYFFNDCSSLETDILPQDEITYNNEYTYINKTYTKEFYEEINNKKEKAKNYILVHP
jgi:hypothetical protein